MLAMFLLYFYWARRFWIGSIFWGISSTIGKFEWWMDAKNMHHLNESALCLWALLFSPFSFLEKLYIDIAMYYRGEQLIRYSNNIRIFVFVFRNKLKPEYYSYSSKNLGPNNIRIRIRPKIWVRILFVFNYFENTNIIRLGIWPPIYWTGVNKKPFTFLNPTSLEFTPDIQF